MFPWSHQNPTLFRRLPIDNAPWPEPLLEIFAGPAATVKLFHKHWPPKTCKHQTLVVLDNVRKSFQTIFHEFPVVRPLLLIGTAQNRTCMLLFVERCIHSIVLVVLDRNHSICLRGRIEAHWGGLQESLGFADGRTRYTSSRIVWLGQAGPGSEGIVFKSPSFDTELKPEKSNKYIKLNASGSEVWRDIMILDVFCYCVATLGVAWSLSD